MNWRKIITVFVIGIIATSSAVGIVSAAPADYKYYYEIDGETYYQETEWGIYPPFVAHPDVSGVYENVTVYDSEGNIVGKGTITRYSGKIMHYSADVEWNSPEVNETTEDTPTSNDWNYTDIEIQSQANKYADNGTKYIDTVTSDNNNITNTQESNNNNNTVGDNNTNAVNGNNNTTSSIDEDNEDTGIPMEQTGGVISIVSIAMIIIIIICVARIIKNN